MTNAEREAIEPGDWVRWQLTPNRMVVDVVLDVIGGVDGFLKTEATYLWRSDVLEVRKPTKE